MDFCDDINKTKGRRALLHCVMSTKRQSQRIFSIILFGTDEIFKIKIWRNYSRVYSGHNCSCISNKACAIPLPETFYFNDVLQNWNRDCYSRMEKPFDCCGSHQSVASSSLLCQGSRSTFLAHFLVFSLFSVFIAEHFWILGFTVCLLRKCNLSETFYQVWVLHRWGGRHNHRQTRSCLLNSCAKN